jgi:raffinose/stachyose/melibiose transport system permease protein
MTSADEIPSRDTGSRLVHRSLGQGGIGEDRPRVSYFAFLSWAVIAVFFVLTLAPFSWLLLSALKTNQELFSNPFGLPSHWSFTNYISAFSAHPLGIYLRNSVVAAVASTFLVLVAASLASYALIHKFRFWRWTYVFLMFGLLLPVNAFIAPIFYLIHWLGLYNSVWGVALVYAGVSFPLGFLVIKTYMDTIPGEILEAGRIDGASFHRIFFQIVLPITLPGIITAAIFLIITAWNELLFASILTQDQGSQTIQVGVRYFLSTYSANYPQAFAATVMAIIPTVLAYIFLSGRIIQGMTAGSLK